MTSTLKIRIDNGLPSLKYAFMLIYPCNPISAGFLIVHNILFHCNIHISPEGNNAY